MDDLILITELNDYIFCPASIYFHKLYGSMDRMIYQNSDQINGTAAHTTVDSSTFSTSKEILTGFDVYCEKYGLIGKIDIYDGKKKLLRERKKKVKQIYDGYIFQIYAQYYCMIEMGYEIKSLEIYSMDDHRHYEISLPEKDADMKNKFENTIEGIRNFNMGDFKQTNALKCERCIYEPSCDRSI